MSGRTLFLDSETFCDVPITHGTHRYAENAEVMLVPWAWDDGSITCWDLTAGEATLADVQALIDAAAEVVLHNSAFDRTVLHHNGVRLPVEKLHDTMVQALSHGLPGSLDKLCEIFGAPAELAKSKEGKRLIHLFCKPQPKNRKIGRATRETHPEDWAAFKRYATLDIESMRWLRPRIPSWNYAGPLSNRARDELELWRLDQTINDRGICIDLELAEAAVRAAAAAQRRLAQEAQDLTDGAVESATKRAKVLAFLSEVWDFHPGDLKGSTIEKLLEQADISPGVRELLEIRQEASATSPAKYKVLTRGTSSDGRLRGTLQFCGAARTGRDGGRLFQPQNLPRPSLKQNDIDLGIEAMKQGVEDLLYDNVMELCTSAVRGSIVAAPGHKLVVADLSNIEGRVTAFLAGEEWKLQAFRDYDTLLWNPDGSALMVPNGKGKLEQARKGHDLYKLAYAKAFLTTPESVVDDQRQIGKVMELMLGYEGGVGAFLTGAATYGFDIEEMAANAIGTLPAEARSNAEGMLAWRRQKNLTTYGLSDTGFIVCEAFKALWRAGHPETCKLWKGLEEAAINAVSTPGHTFRYGLIAFQRDDAWLRVRLPSGRYLCYAAPELDESGRKLSYMGIHQITRRWQRLKTYGGKLCIAEGTPVLTHEGWVPIEQVTARHLVWDGVEWVSQGGLARQGVKAVIKAHGVWMTPDHEVLTEAGWVCASQSERHQRAACRLPHGYSVLEKQRPPVSVGGAVRLRGRDRDDRLGSGEAVAAGHSSFLRMPAASVDRSGAADPRDEQAPGLRGVAIDDRPLPPVDASGVAKLRRARDQGLRALGDVLRGVLGRHGADVPAGADDRAPEQLRRLRAGQLRVGHLQDPGEQPQAPRRMVYDLVSCGPRRRFVVADENGQPLIVHNCENVVQAFARDILFHGVRLAEQAGYRIVLRVHDELVCEVPDTPQFTAEGLAALMATNPPWADGLPLAAAGFETYRYRKG